MATYKTKAIILSSYPYREYDRIVYFFSEDYGLVSARARGSRKLASKLAGHLEPFIETELLLARGRRWDILAGSRTVETQARVRQDLSLLAGASVCCEAVKLICKPMAKDNRVWELLRGVLSAMSLRAETAILAVEAKQSYRRDKDISTLESSSTRLSDCFGRLALPRNDMVYNFLWNLLSVSGFAPEIGKCIHCRLRVNDGYFSHEGGGALCNNCCHRDPLAVKIKRDDVTALLGASSTLSESAREIIINWWRTVVAHAPLKSWEFWEAMGEPN